MQESTPLTCCSHRERERETDLSYSKKQKLTQNKPQTEQKVRKAIYTYSTVRHYHLDLHDCVRLRTRPSHKLSSLHSIIYVQSYINKPCTRTEAAYPPRYVTCIQYRYVYVHEYKSPQRFFHDIGGQEKRLIGHTS